MKPQILAFNGVLDHWRTNYPADTLKKRLALIFGHETAKYILSRYPVTSEAGGRLVWWQTDGRGTATTARITSNTWNGGTDYTTRPDWLHRITAAAGRTPADYNPPRHFYGLHLLTPGARVLVVNDEASALYLAALNHAEPNNTIAGQYDTIIAACGCWRSACWYGLPALQHNAARVTIAADEDTPGAMDAASRHGWRLVRIIPDGERVGNIAAYVTAHRRREWLAEAATLTPHGLFVDPRRQTPPDTTPDWLKLNTPYLSPWRDGTACWQVVPNEATHTFFVFKCHHITGALLDVCQVPAPTPEDGKPSHDFHTMQDIRPARWRAALWRSYLWGQEAAGNVLHHLTQQNNFQ